MEKIKFYNVTDEYGAFSNFAEFPIEIDGKLWQTSEHYYQAQKYTEADYKEKIREACTPVMAAKLGRTNKIKNRDDWDSIKDSVMYDVVKAKFTQHSNLKELLLSTKDKEIIEHTENDDYWGDGGNGQGKNMLGKILMKVREELKNIK